ncbi:MAG: formate--tetrahydrofolate ligase [Gammaproteobacteria bacterium]|nr:formate--tetrahydrofolate ligase [Gammaproteobacteria bacterium]
MATNLEIERSYPKRPIQEVAEELGIDPAVMLPHGHHIAKIPQTEVTDHDGNDGALVLVTAMSPTPSGEGKTTTTIGLGDALRKAGRKTALCLREPSLGPYFGIKGGGTGTGQAQVVPAEDINLHFVGDMYSVEKANNLLAALLDNHLQHGNDLDIDPRRITWRRVIDLNDRALREIFIGLGGVTHGIPRKDGVDITPASEVMAILCLAQSYRDLRDRLERIVVGYTYHKEPITAGMLRAHGAMTVLLRDAIHPNLVQTLHGTPALVHGGPFANIAHGCNTIFATKLALKLCERVVTEAGFASDLGAEKFFDIKCRIGNLEPSAVVIVATQKAVEYHGGFTAAGGSGNLLKHIENVRAFGLEPVVAVNRFPDDDADTLRRIVDFCGEHGVRAALYESFEKGPEGAAELARLVEESIEQNQQAANFQFLYPDSAPLREKIDTIARVMYGADGVDYDRNAELALDLIEETGHGQVPVCMAKTQQSLSDTARLRGRPTGFRIRVNEATLSAGAGFVVARCGKIMTMPGLPREPAAVRIEVDDDGNATGLT